MTVLKKVFDILEPLKARPAICMQKNSYVILMSRLLKKNIILVIFIGFMIILLTGLRAWYCSCGRHVNHRFEK